MKIELKKISLSKTLSEETPAYTAQVWVDGKHFCDVANHGQGGCDMHYPPKGQDPHAFHARLAALEKRIAAEYPRESYEAGGETHSYDSSLETVCMGLLDEWEEEKKLRADLRRKIMWVKDGKIWQVPIKGRPLPALIAAVKQRYGLARVFNEMRLAEALAALRGKDGDGVVVFSDGSTQEARRAR